MEIRQVENGERGCQMTKKAGTTEWTLQLTSSPVIVIPNFFESYQKQFNKKIDKPNVKFWYYTPYIGSRTQGFVCNIITGSWYKYNSIPEFNSVNTTCIANVARAENRTLLKHITTLETRIKKLETLFDHVREKSSMIDEFIKTAEQAITSDNTTVQEEEHKQQAHHR